MPCFDVSLLVTNQLFNQYSGKWNQISNLIQKRQFVTWFYIEQYLVAVGIRKLYWTWPTHSKSTSLPRNRGLIRKGRGRWSPLPPVFETYIIWFQKNYLSVVSYMVKKIICSPKFKSLMRPLPSTYFYSNWTLHTCKKERPGLLHFILELFIVRSRPYNLL